jgi:hypothetical protein
MWLNNWKPWAFFWYVENFRFFFLSSNGTDFSKFCGFCTCVVLYLLSDIIWRLMDNMKLLLICILRVLLSQSFIFFRFYFFINVYMVLFLFNNVIYVFLLLWLCILIVYIWLPWLRVFPCFFLSCKANGRVKPAKTGHGPHSS